MKELPERNEISLADSPAPGFVVIVSGVSGAGKGSVINKLKELREDFVLSVSTTTRPPRKEGTIGEHYAHVDIEEFHDLASSGEFLEWAEVHGHLYGTRRDWVLEKIAEGYIVILEIDVQGAIQVMTKNIDQTSVFVTPPDRQTAYDRLKRRGTETEEDIKRRIRNSDWEFDQMNQFDYMVVNVSGKLDETAQTLSAIITAERAKMTRSSVRP
ncbi:MAG TPA: guanylate kinase [bacterium]|jgi:guanylate kinase